MNVDHQPEGIRTPTERGPYFWVVGLVAVLAPVAGLMYWASKPGDASLRQAANAHAAEGRWDQVHKMSARLGQPQPEDWLLRASAAHALNRDHEALRDLAHVPNEGPVAARRALLVGQIEQSKNRARPLEAALREAIRLDPSMTPARRLLVYLYGLQERRPELLEQFSELASRGPITVDLALHWGLSHGPIGDPAESLTALQNFVAADPDDRASRLALAEVERRVGRLDDARRTLDALPATDADARAIRSQIETDRGDNTAATALLADGPEDHASLARLRGRRALSRRDGPAAVRAFRISDKLDPENLETLFVLAQALRLAGDKAEADRVSTRATAHQALRTLLVDFSGAKSARPVDFLKIGSACESVGRKAEADAWYRLAIAASPLDAEAQRALHRLRTQTSRPDKPAP